MNRVILLLCIVAMLLTILPIVIFKVYILKILPKKAKHNAILCNNSMILLATIKLITSVKFV